MLINRRPTENELKSSFGSGFLSFNIIISYNITLLSSFIFNHTTYIIVYILHIYFLFPFLFTLQLLCVYIYTWLPSLVFLMGFMSMLMALSLFFVMPLGLLFFCLFVLSYSAVLQSVFSFIQYSTLLSLRSLIFFIIISLSLHGFFIKNPNPPHFPIPLLLSSTPANFPQHKI